MGVENLAECRAQRMVVNGSKTNWQLLMIRFPQQSIQRQVLFNIFRSDVDDTNECTIPRFAYDTKLGAERETLEGRAAIQTDFDRLEDCISKNCVSFDK